MDPVMLFSKATARGCEVMAGVSVDQLARPTPCTEWSVQDLIDRMVGSTGYLTAALEGREPLRLSFDAAGAPTRIEPDAAPAHV